MAAIGSPEKVTAAVKELEANHVTHFISYLDAGGLSFDEISGSLQLFSQKVMPNFRKVSFVSCWPVSRRIKGVPI